MSYSATALIADLVRKRAPGWVEDQLHDGFMFVFGDPSAVPPGRHIICDALTDHPIITANVGRRRIVMELRHVSDRDDALWVIEALTAFGALDEMRGSVSHERAVDTR